MASGVFFKQGRELQFFKKSLWLQNRGSIGENETEAISTDRKGHSIRWELKVWTRRAFRDGYIIQGEGLGLAEQCGEV